MNIQVRAVIIKILLLVLNGCTLNGFAREEASTRPWIPQQQDKTIICPSHQFKCADTSFCVPNSWKCDGTNDCPDGTDEQSCGKKSCGSSSLFTCDNGKCVLASWKCDGQDDCGDNSDERSEICPEKVGCEFRCDNGNCLASVWVCDNYNDCGDNSDEKSCGNTTRAPSLTTSVPINAQKTDTRARTTRTRAMTVETSAPTTKTREPTVTSRARTTSTRAPTTSTRASITSRCSPSDFKCPDEDRCIAKEWVCDGDADCKGGSDEQSCGRSVTTTSGRTQPTSEPTQPTPSLCSFGQFECRDKSKCVRNEWKCDGFRDCQDNSDEEGCGFSSTTPGPTTSSSTQRRTTGIRALWGQVNACSENQFQCDSGSCTFLTWRCDDDYDCQDQSDEKNCDGTRRPTSRAGSPILIPGCGTGRFQCITSGVCIHQDWVCDRERDCSDGSDEVSCVESRSILLAAGTRIDKVSDDLRSVENVYKGRRGQVSGAVALDADIQTQIFYWSDVKRKEIRSGSVSGQTSVVTISSGLGTVEGIAVDWIARNIYWTDSLLSSIEVASLTGRNRKKLIKSNLDKPRGIAVHPSGYIFWTEWGIRPRLSRCSMDGEPSSRRVLIDREILWPNAVTIDYSTDTLWWADAKLKKIESCKLDGSDRQVVFSSIGYPFSLAVSSRYVYWTNWKTKKLHRAEKFSSYKNVQRTSAFRSHPFAIALIDGGRHTPVRSQCAVKKGGCSHLCLLSRNQDRFSCQCPDGMELGLDRKSCKIGALKNCPDKQFRCDRYQCLDASKKCDGKQDCVDGTDEHYCLTDKPRLVFGDRRKHVAICDLTQQSRYKVITKVQSVTGIDVDIKNGYVFWADTGRNAIMKTALDHKGDVLSTTTVTDTLVFTPEGLAFDWITNKLYWIDSHLDKIEVIDVDGKYRYSVVTKGLDRPRSIVLHPKTRYLYWTDWGKLPYVAKIAMDGDPDTRRKVVARGIVWPNAVTIDYESDTLYWVEAHPFARPRMEKLDVYGGGRTTYFAQTPLLTRPFALAVNREFIYWSDWALQKIYRMNKYNKKYNKVVQGLRVHYPMELAIIDKSQQRQVLANPCAAYNGGCSHICLLSPSYRRQTCRCPTGMGLKKDKKTCQSLYRLGVRRTNSLLDTDVL